MLRYARRWLDMSGKNKRNSLREAAGNKSKLNIAVSALTLQKLSEIAQKLPKELKYRNLIYVASINNLRKVNYLLQSPHTQSKRLIVSFTLLLLLNVGITGVIAKYYYWHTIGLN